jgi:hypothetical protein
MENTLETVKEVLAITHESNRLGMVVLSRDELFSVREHLNFHGDIVFYAWDEYNGRAFGFPTLNEAAKFVGFYKPTGCADYEGKVKLGKFVERGQHGEIWKDDVNFVNSVYYVWSDDHAASYFSLAIAREVAGVSTKPKNPRKLPPKTQPKSSNPQNCEGYRADNYSSKPAKRS